MPSNFEKFQTLLEELFQLDQADLDFGIYRIMNQKRDEIVRFLEKDLLPQVKAAFSQYKSADKAMLQEEVDKLVEQITTAGMNPDDSPKVQELRQQIAESSVDVTALENEVFSHLYTFFRRYYDEGDFISLRRYKEGVYAIPYEGEEVKLHWANHDQYYIKSSEYLRDYAFILPSGNRVRFHLTAASTEHANKKEAPDKERRFILCDDSPLAEEDGELLIRFRFQPDDKKRKQSELNDEAVKQVLGASGFDNWMRELSLAAPTAKDADRTLLAKHLARYTARNTFDYFIHKDLGRFLRQELDFYIKNEVIHLDDIENDTAPRVDQYISKIRVLRFIAHKIIQFVEQLEDFQRRLWLKKKFVVEAHYCVTLDRVPHELYPQIAANDAQRKEWVSLFCIDEIEPELNGPGYSEPLSVEFLKAHPFLVLDTRFFDDAFKWSLLGSIDQLDSSTDGLLVESDNFHALRLLSARYRQSVPCIYIDPPYNTSENTFVYKNSYKHSSWISMMSSRLEIAYDLLGHDGTICVAIDDTEAAHIRLVLDHMFGAPNRVATIAAEVNPAGQNLRPNVPALSHDYCLVYAKDIERMEMLLRGLTDEERQRYGETDAQGPYLWDNLRRRGGNSRPSDRPKQWFPLYADLKTQKVSVDPFEGSQELWPIDPKGERRIWRVNLTGARREIAAGNISVVEKAGRPEIIKKTRMPEGKKPKTLWAEPRYSATTHGSKLLIDILGSHRFSYPKSLHLVQDCLRHWLDDDETVLDFFAGSGTTGHAVINSNRADGGDRKYILVDVGSYFGTVLKPRIQKVVYSRDWQRGRPVSRNGTSHMFKYLRLESYEDTLDNLSLRRVGQQEELLGTSTALREEYLLSYMLDVESRGSQSLLNIDAFRAPQEYKLRVERAGETQAVNVDLVETFNLLLGLTVKHIDFIRGVVVVEGTNPDDEQVLVLWRNLDEIENDALDKWFGKQGYNTKEQIYDIFYVNGDNNLENLRREDQTWKVRLIEDEFQRLMFDL